MTRNYLHENVYVLNKTFANNTDAPGPKQFNEYSCADILGGSLFYVQLSLALQKN